jgi:hypothetical protein
MRLVNQNNVPIKVFTHELYSKIQLKQQNLKSTVAFKTEIFDARNMQKRQILCTYLRATTNVFLRTATHELFG